MSTNDDFSKLFNQPGTFRQHVFGDLPSEARIAFMQLCELDERIRECTQTKQLRVVMPSALFADQPLTAKLLLPARPHKELPIDLRYPFLAVRVTAADFNGQSFDGAPLVPVNGEQDEEVITIIAKLMKEKSPKLRIESRGGTDYAWFGIVDDYNNVTWAGPGDYIVGFKKEATALVEERYVLRVVPSDFYNTIFLRTPIGSTLPLGQSPNAQK